MCVCTEGEGGEQRPHFTCSESDWRWVYVVVAKVRLVRLCVVSFLCVREDTPGAQRSEEAAAQALDPRWGGGWTMVCEADGGSACAGICSGPSCLRCGGTRMSTGLDNTWGVVGGGGKMGGLQQPSTDSDLLLQDTVHLRGRRPTTCQNERPGSK